MGSLIKVLALFELLACAFSLEVSAPVTTAKPLEKCSKVSVGCIDCVTLSLCMAAGKDPIPVPCDSSQFCNEGTCSTTPSSECSGGGSASGFNCPLMDGHYPDPSNCRMYHICVNGTAADYSCEDNQVYSTQTRSCVRQTLANKCQTVNCKDLNGRYSLYPPDHRYAFYCLGGTPMGFMMACGESQEYNTTSNECEVKCNKEGIVPSPEGEEFFVECVAAGLNNYVQIKRQCPFNDDFKSIFDPNTLECVLSESNSNSTSIY